MSNEKRSKDLGAKEAPKSEAIKAPVQTADVSKETKEPQDAEVLVGYKSAVKTITVKEPTDENDLPLLGPGDTIVQQSLYSKEHPAGCFVDQSFIGQVNFIEEVARHLSATGKIEVVIVENKDGSKTQKAFWK